MNIGLVIYGDLEVISGGYLYDREMLAHLRSSGHRAQVFSLPWRSYARHLADNLDAGLLEQLATASVDVLIQDELNHASLFHLNRRLRQRAHLPLISLVHHLRSDEPHNPLLKILYAWIEHRYLNFVDGFIYNSHSTRRSVERLTNVQRPSVVAYPGRDHVEPEIDNQEIIRRAHSPGPLRILFLGNLTPRKGLDVLIAALELVEHEAWRLDVIGDTSMERRYSSWIRALVERSGYAGQIQLHGAQPKEVVAQYLKGSHVMALPSFHEGFGLAYLEAMGFGLPVIGTSAGGPKELIQDRETGFLITPGDHSSLAGRLERLIADRSRLAEMGIAAQARYRDHPTWNESMRRVAGLLEGLI